MDRKVGRAEGLQGQGVECVWRWRGAFGDGGGGGGGSREERWGWEGGVDWVCAGGVREGERIGCAVLAGGVGF